VKKARTGHPGAARALAENRDATRDIYAERYACFAALEEAGQELARAWDHVDLPPIKPITTRINLFRADAGGTFDIGEIGLFRNDSGAARTTAQQKDTDRSVGRGRRQRCVPDRAAQPLPTADARVGPTPVSPAGSRRAAPPAVIPAVAFVAPGIKPVIRARGTGAEPSAGFSEAARCSAAGVPAAMSEAPSVMAAACFSQSGQRDGDQYRQ
jgi:hypothetical protein